MKLIVGPKDMKYFDFANVSILCKTKTDLAFA